MTKQILTQAQLKELLEYNSNTGLFIRIKNSGSTKKGMIAGCMDINGYYTIRIHNKLYYSHRLAWLYTHGEFPSMDIDHINSNKSDNRIVNLRLANRSENMQNKIKARSDNMLNILGVSFKKKLVKNPYSAKITIDGKSKHLGYFKTSELAHNAYLEEKRNLHEFCTI